MNTHAIGIDAANNGVGQGLAASPSRRLLPGSTTRQAARLRPAGRRLPHPTSPTWRTGPQDRPGHRLLAAVQGQVATGIDQQLGHPGRWPTSIDVEARLRSANPTLPHHHRRTRCTSPHPRRRIRKPGRRAAPAVRPVSTRRDRPRGGPFANLPRYVPEPVELLRPGGSGGGLAEYARSRVTPTAWMWSPASTGTTSTSPGAPIVGASPRHHRHHPDSSG